MHRLAFAAFAFAFAFASGVLAFASPARADDAPETDAPRADEVPERHVAVEVNPLALGLLRAGGNVEIALARHHALVGSGFYASRWASTKGDDVVVTTRSFGGELGYRYYTGPRPLEGAFFGGSGIVERVLPTDTGGYGAVLWGGALDVGGHVVTKGGVVLGAGAGVQYTTITVPRVEVTSFPVLSGAGLYPRLLLEIGYAL